MQRLLKTFLFLLMLGLGPLAFGQDDQPTEDQPTGMNPDKGGKEGETKAPEKVYVTRMRTWNLEPHLGQKIGRAHV